jgi:hypothetical protein
MKTNPGESRRLPSRENVQMINVGLNPEDHRALKLIALDERITMAEVARRAITEWLQRRTKRRPAREKRRQ